MNETSEVLFKLLRVALGNETDFKLPHDVDWNKTIDMSFRQGLAAITVDGLQMIYEADSDMKSNLDGPEFEEMKYDWFGFCLTVVKEYNAHAAILAHLAKFFQNQQVPMMLLKGYGLSLDYPIPNHRPPGDIDIYLWDKWKIADRMVEKKLDISVNNSRHHHSVFIFEDYLVENHYDFVNVHSHRSSKSVELTFKNLAEDRSKAIKHELPDGSEIFFPSPNLNILFVLRHCASHFAAESINLRQLLDWVLFVDRHHGDVDWALFWTEVDKMGMARFTLCVIAIATEQLGFDSSVFHIPDEYESFALKEHSLVERVLEDILCPKSFHPGGKSVLRYVLSRLNCWWHNRWKHKIVYSDSLSLTFFAQLWSHLMKPATLAGRF